MYKKPKQNQSTKKSSPSSSSSSSSIPDKKFTPTNTKSTRSRFSTTATSSSFPSPSRHHKATQPTKKSIHTTYNNNNHHNNTNIFTTNRAKMSTTSSTTTTPTTPNTLRVGLCQVKVTPNKSKNLETASEAVGEAVLGGARLVVLPECFQTPYATDAFPQYQELIPAVGTTANQFCPTANQTTHHLSQLAIQHQIFLVGGSIPERENDIDGSGFKTFNTSVVFDPNGSIVAKHRKLHLFDIDIPGKITFRESDSLTSGDAITTFTIPTAAMVSNLTDSFRSELTIALGICYDVRFAEYALVARQVHNADAIIYPGAFNMTTGPAHWSLLQKARALDNQMYVMAVSPARAIPNDPENVNADGKPYQYVAWGHSSAISPWADVLCEADAEPAVLIADLDFEKMDQIRDQIPISKQRRPDVYTLTATAKKM